MTFTGSGARELRKKARAALDEAAALTRGVSGLGKAGKVAKLTQARDLAQEAADNLAQAVTRAESVQEAPAATASTAAASSAASKEDLAAALATIGRALGVSS